MEKIQSWLNMGPYSSYVWSAVGIALLGLLILFIQSQKQLKKQKKALSKSQRSHEN